MSRDTMVKIQSCDGQMFEVEKSVVQEFKTLRRMIEDTGTGNTIPLPTVNSELLAKVIEYARYHVEAQKSSDEKPAVPEDEIREWDVEFAKVDSFVLHVLIGVARYLDAANLVDLLVQTRADIRRDLVKVKMEQMLEIFNSGKVDVFASKEEEDDARRELQWALGL